MVIFGDPVSGLQIFGYSIALAGLVYYKLGGEKLKEYYYQAGRQWAEYGQTRPVARRMIVIGGVLFVLILLVGGFGNHLPSAYNPNNLAQNTFNSFVGDKVTPHGG